MPSAVPPPSLAPRVLLPLYRIPLRTCRSHLVILTPAVSPSLAHDRRTPLIPAPTKNHACWPPHQLDPTPAGPYLQNQLPLHPG